MFIKRIREKFGVNNPIFTYEILETFKEYSVAYVFRLLNQSLDKKEILKFCRGVYFIPTECILGLSTIIQEDIVEKKYISNNDDVYGIYGGIYLENCFHLTTQVPKYN